MFESRIAALREAGYPNRTMKLIAVGFAIALLSPERALGDLAGALATAGAAYLVLAAVMLGLLQLASRRGLIEAPGAVHVLGNAVAAALLVPLTLFLPAGGLLTATVLLAAPIIGTLLAGMALWFHRRGCGQVDSAG